MRSIQTAMPRRELKEFVKVFAQRAISYTSEGFKQLDVASLGGVLTFSFGDSVRVDYTNGKSKYAPPISVIGSQMARSSCAHYCGSHFDFGIFLKPLALWQLFRIPPAVLADGDGDSRDVIGNSIHTFWLQLAESKTFQQRIQVAEEYLLPFAINARPQTLVMKTAQFIYRHQGMVRIQDLADYSSLSLRQYERRFVTEIGFTPKLFARVARFEMALDTKRIASGQSWLTVAHQLGYFDQMHMVRDFQQLGGDVPSEIFQQIGDIQPWSLAPPANPSDFSDPGQRRRPQKWA